MTPFAMPKVSLGEGAKPWGCCWCMSWPRVVAANTSILSILSILDFLDPTHQPAEGTDANTHSEKSLP